MHPIYWILAATALCIPHPLWAQTVESFVDHSSSGWSYKENDQAFRLKTEACTIQWNAVHLKSGRATLSMRSDCQSSFAAQAPMHAEILKAIHKKWPLSTFTGLNWGSLCRGGDYSFCLPIAQASMTHPDYVDYWQHYPNSKLSYPNGLFVELANQTQSYQALADLFKPYALVLTLDSVEKVFSARLNEAPFSQDLVVKGKIKNPRVMVDVGMSSFSIAPLKAAAP